MAVEIKMPDLGTTVEQVTVTKWLKQIGDEVKRGDSLCEVETDKATTELESAAQGVLLKQVVQEGTEISVGDLIAYIGEPGEIVA
ncbi:MAG: biotin/lipoyl-containing protein [Planctomycetota bacterium]